MIYELQQLIMMSYSTEKRNISPVDFGCHSAPW